jgi:AmiR/NasT family two-component response regulator
VTADEAFTVLAQASMAGSRELRVVAEHLVTTGELLVPTRS